MICEDEAKEQELLAKKQCLYSQIDLPKSGQQVLQHMAAHIHYDSSIKASQEPCSLCLRYSQCIFYLTKGKGKDALPRIDEKYSHCLNFTNFSYAMAMTSTQGSPCLNVPLKCPFCPSSAPAVWRYNMQYHLRARHAYVSLPENEAIWKIGHSEKEGLKKIWADRKKVKKV